MKEVKGKSGGNKEESVRDGIEGDRMRTRTRESRKERIALLYGMTPSFLRLLIIRKCIMCRAVKRPVVELDRDRNEERARKATKARNSANEQRK